MALGLGLGLGSRVPWCLGRTPPRLTQRPLAALLGASSSRFCERDARQGQGGPRSVCGVQRSSAPCRCRTVTVMFPCCLPASPSCWFFAKELGCVGLVFLLCVWEDWFTREATRAWSWRLLIVGRFLISNLITSIITNYNLL